ncbi:MAG TPA: hypothetical protein VJ843_04315 [Candidatus Saccharimonadales bacterium]|nr:hypothetical protein [Candidatus Saccharimonadales bacterium]
MSKTVKLVVIAVAVVVIAGGAIYVQNHGKHKNDTTSTGSSSSSSSNNDTAKTTDSTTAAMTITYDGSSFSMSPSSIKSGENVKIVNSSSSELDFDSDPHPTHTDNPELNVGSIAAGESKTITLTTKGTWGFHNHLDPSQHGNLTVE